jgi:hypothetical protein
MRSGYHHNHSVPFVRVDPDNRCAAMLVYGKKIVILPFKRDAGAGSAADNEAHKEMGQAKGGGAGKDFAKSRD